MNLPKHEVARKLLLKGPMNLHLNPRVPGVVVPARFKHQTDMMLHVGLDMPVPIVKLEVTERGLSGGFSFQRELHFCYIPWEAVFAMMDEENHGTIWGEQIPAELAERMARVKLPKQKPKPYAGLPGKSDIRELKQTKNGGLYERAEGNLIRARFGTGGKGDNGAAQ